MKLTEKEDKKLREWHSRKKFNRVTIRGNVHTYAVTKGWDDAIFYKIMLLDGTLVARFRSNRPVLGITNAILDYENKFLQDLRIGKIVTLDGVNYQIRNQHITYGVIKSRVKRLFRQRTEHGWVSVTKEETPPELKNWKEQKDGLD